MKQLRLLCCLLFCGCNLFGGVAENNAENENLTPDMSTRKDASTMPDLTEDASNATIVVTDAAIDLTTEDVSEDQGEDIPDGEEPIWVPGYDARASATPQIDPGLTITDVTLRIELPSTFATRTEGDLRITVGQDPSPLPFAIERWDNDAVVVWAGVPSLDATTPLHFFTDGGNGDQADATQIWENYALVMPLDGNFDSLVPVAGPTTIGGSFAPGFHGEAWQGDGNGFVAFDADPAVFNLRDPGVLSLEFRAKAAFQNYEQIIILNESFCRGFAIQQDEVGFYGQIADNPCGEATYPTAIFQQAGIVEAWRHFVVIFDLDQDVIELYIDGVLAAVSQVPTDRSVSMENSNFRIGAAFNGDRPYLGLLDDLHMYRFRKTPEQIAVSASGVEFDFDTLQTR